MPEFIERPINHYSSQGYVIIVFPISNLTMYNDILNFREFLIQIQFSVYKYEYS